MLSKRLRRRLRQIDGRAATPADNSFREAAPEKAPSRAAMKLGVPGLSRSAMEGRSRIPVEAARPGGRLEELAPGEVARRAEGSYWLVMQSAAEMLPHGAEILAHLETIQGSGSAGGLEEFSATRPSELVLLDTETAGLAAAPVFLVGVIIWRSDAVDDAVSLQLLARDYAEERAVLAASAELLQGRRVLMTYNGKSFDLPLIRERMIYHGLGDCPEPPCHVDLLHLIRARYRECWENCRLVSVEQNLCGRSRWDDIDGARIPDAYHDFVRTGDAGQMARVLEHNRLDLITMLEALPYLQDGGHDR